MQKEMQNRPVGYAPTKTEALILLATYNNSPWEIDREKVTLAVLYQRWLKIKALNLEPQRKVP